MSICFVIQGGEQMRQYRLRRTGMLFLLFPALFVLAACGSQPPPQQAAATPTPTLPEVASALVHFSTMDHVQLGGLLYGKGGRTAIICSHQFPSTKVDWSDSAPWFAARGFMVLAYDFRGRGDSQGQYDPSKEDQDLLAAIAFVHSHGAKQVILLGASMGADISLIVAARTRVAGVIARSPEYLFGLSNNEIRAISAPSSSLTARVIGLPLIHSRCSRM